MHILGLSIPDPEILSNSVGVFPNATLCTEEREDSVPHATQRKQVLGSGQTLAHDFPVPLPGIITNFMGFN